VVYAAGSAGIVLDTGKVAAAAAFAHASERAGGFAELSCAEGTLLPALREKNFGAGLGHRRARLLGGDWGVSWLPRSPKPDKLLKNPCRQQEGA
jgi:hypothetical protein